MDLGRRRYIKATKGWFFGLAGLARRFERGWPERCMAGSYGVSGGFSDFGAYTAKTLL
jgi:hypothetical protein